MDYIHKPVMMHYVLDSLQELPVPHIFVVRLVVKAINHCREEKKKKTEAFFWTGISHAHQTIKIIFSDSYITD